MKNCVGYSIHLWFSLVRFRYFCVSLVHVHVYNHQKPQCPSTDTQVHFIPALSLMSAHTELIMPYMFNVQYIE